MKGEGYSLATRVRPIHSKTRKKARRLLHKQGRNDANLFPGTSSLDTRSR